MDSRIRDFTKMIDFTAVTTYASENDVKELVENAKKYKFKAVGVMPCFMPLAEKLLEGEEDVILAGGISFPSGAEKTLFKCLQARDYIAHGCKELDMVMNVAFMKSGRYKDVEEDIKAVIDTAAGVPVKVIIEMSYLTEDEIKRACEILIRQGADFVKTATGWAPTPTSLDYVKLIKSIVGDSIKIKAAGGVRNLDTVLAMNEVGVTRFGIGKTHALKIMDEFLSRFNLSL